MAQQRSTGELSADDVEPKDSREGPQVRPNMTEPGAYNQLQRRSSDSPSFDHGDAANTVDEKTLDLKVLTMECELCKFMGLCVQYEPTALYICKHPDCLPVKGADHARMAQIVCVDCAETVHKKKAHSFNVTAVNVLCVADMFEPEEEQFKGQKQLVYKLKIDNISQLEVIIHKTRWLSGIPAYALVVGGHIGVSHLVHGVPCFLAAWTAGPALTGAALALPALGAGIGAAVAGALEIGWVWYQFSKGRLTKEQRNELMKIAVGSNVVSAGAFIATTALFAATCVALPPAALVGIAVGVAALAAFLVRFGLQWYFSRSMTSSERQLKLMEKEALKFFFGEHNKDFILDGTDETKRKIKLRYNELALQVHPDRPNGNIDEWNKLCGFYGFLTGLWEKRRGYDNLSDMKPHEKASIISSVVKDKARQEGEITDEEIEEESEKTGLVVSGLHRSYGVDC